MLWNKTNAILGICLLFMPYLRQIKNKTWLSSLSLLFMPYLRQIKNKTWLSSLSLLFMPYLRQIKNKTWLSSLCFNVLVLFEIWFNNIFCWNKTEYFFSLLYTIISFRYVRTRTNSSWYILTEYPSVNGDIDSYVMITSS
jgi:hypothetical protein